MSYFVRGSGVMETHHRFRSRQEPPSLYRAGFRKYVTTDERRRIATIAATLPVDQSLFMLMLSFTGARISEALNVRAASFDVQRGLVALETLKRRRSAPREIPLPPKFMSDLDRCFAISDAQRDVRTATVRLWPWCRTTAFVRVKRVMERAGVTGVAASPRGLRHGFAIGALEAGIPLNLVQRWMGHASMSTTAIYAAAMGPEEIAFAERFWRLAEQDVHV